MTYNYEDLDESFTNAPDPEDGFRTVPPGTYQVYVDRATFDCPDWDPEYPQLKLTCKVVSGDFAGCAVFPSAGCNPEYIQYLKAILVKMGMDPVPKPSEIEGRLEDMLNRVLEVAVVANKKKPEYPKVYVNRFIRMMDEGESSQTNDDDEIPF